MSTDRGDGTTALTVRSAREAVDLFLADLREREPRLADLRDEIDRGYEQLAADLRKAESAMVERWDGRAAAVEIPPFEARGPGHIPSGYALFFGPWGGQWGLWLIDGRPNQRQVRRIEQWPRAIRQRAVYLLPDLVEALQYEDELDPPDAPLGEE